MASVYIENYGCTANYDDGAIMAGILTEANHSIVKDIAECDVAIINSCAVKNVTVNKIFSKIEKIKKDYKIKLIITGCMPVSEKDKLKKFISDGFALVSTQNISEIANVVEKVLNNEQVIITNKIRSIKTGFPKIIGDNKIVSIQIAHGCKSFCGFCSTKFAKGDLVSYPKEEIVKEAKKYIEAGYKRINLTSTDNACYGFDLGYNLAILIKEVVELDGDFTIRVGMGNPEHIIKYFDELVEVYKNHKVMKFLHLPVQSGSNNVLMNMRRKYTIEEFEAIIKKFREEIPEITISTDIIVGYPSETEKDFDLTIDLVKKLKFEVINISKFASRPHTPASKMKQLSSQLIKQRSIALTKLYNEIRSENNYINKNRLVVIQN